MLTGAEWITTRFGAGRGGELSRVIIVVFALVSVVGFIAYDFQGMGKFSKTFLPWDLSANTYAVIVMGITAIYVLLGGMISVVITDLAQFVIMALCAVIIAWIAMAKVSAAEVAALIPAGWESLVVRLEAGPGLVEAHSRAAAEHCRRRLRLLHVFLHRDAVQGHAGQHRRPGAELRHAAHPGRRARRARPVS